MNQPSKASKSVVTFAISTLLAGTAIFAQQPPAPNQVPSPNANKDRGSNPKEQKADTQQFGERGKGGRSGTNKADRGGPGGNNGNRGGSKLGNYTSPPAPNNVPDHVFNIILGRPSESGISIRILFNHEATARVDYGTSTDAYSQQSPTIRFSPKTPSDFVLTGLSPNTRYYYRIVYSLATGENQRSDEYTFHTQRSPGNSFVFTVQSDSHLDENTSGDVYLRTLANALSDQPDFHFELGDTFMTGKYVEPHLAEPQYFAQRYYLGHLCHSSALFFAMGNHDGESGGRGDMTWATKTRKKLFPNPFPDRFYTGNDEPEPELGFAENYYQWKWGDAQFIVLDPFRYTTRRGRESTNWAWTLGDRQYRWLKSSLENTDAKFRFVFLHHLVGGSTTNNRGGVEVAPFWEWGGKGESGEDEFAKNRPGWEAPIHELLCRHGVSVVFHGHDHLFIKQDLDGIVYQLVPQPGHARMGNTNSAKEYGYISGETQSSSGHIRARITPESARIDYVRAFLADNENQNRRNGQVTYSYEVIAK